MGSSGAGLGSHDTRDAIVDFVRHWSERPEIPRDDSSAASASAPASSTTGGPAVAGTFFYRCSLLDGCSRFIVHWEICTSMTEPEAETIIQRGRERYPDARPRIISDSGPQFIAKDFREFIRIWVMTHYNEVCLQRAIGYVAPAAKLAARDRAIFAERDRKLDAARERRWAARAANRTVS